MSSFLLDITGLKSAIEEELPKGQPKLGWENVAVASGFILVNGKSFNSP